MLILGFIACFIMGIVLGLMGGGGAILTVPIMVYLFQFSPTVATGYSLFVVGVTALIGATIYVRKGDVDFKVALWFAIPSMIGVNISRGLIVPAIPAVIVNFNAFVLTKDILVMVTFATLMLAAAYSMIKKRQQQTPAVLSRSYQTFLIVFEGLFVGLIAGFVGAGGGFLIIPALVLLAGLSMRVAVGTSLMIIAFQSLLGFAGDVSRGALIDWTFIATVAAVAAVGIVFGSSIARRFDEQKLKITFVWFVLAMGAFILIEQIRHI